MLTKERYKDALAVLRKAASFNRVAVSDKDWEDLEENLRNEETCHKAHVSTMSVQSNTNGNPVLMSASQSIDASRRASSSEKVATSDAATALSLLRKKITSYSVTQLFSNAIIAR